MAPFAHQVPDGWRGQAATFDRIFLVFLILGTLVGVVVVGYMLYNAYKYREGGATTDAEFEPPTVGELPTGGKGGKKLFVSFGISAIIVISLVAWTYTALLWVEEGAQEEVDPEWDIEINAIQFGWTAEYPNGETAFTTEWNDDSYIAIPEDTMVGLDVTSDNVWHTFGITELRIKVDAIPGQVAESWLLVEEQGSYDIECFELCGAGHSGMHGTLEVIDRDEFEERFVDDPEDEEEDENEENGTEYVHPPSESVTGVSTGQMGAVA